METMIPLAALSHYNAGNAPLSVNHQGLFVAATISFNLHAGRGARRRRAARSTTRCAQIRMPAAIHGSLAGTAQVFQQSLANEPILIAAAIAAVYILLGVLYESYIHPITILSTLPSAGVGALLALMLFHTEFDIIGLIGVILLIGIVKKNAIMMIDFAIEAKRRRTQFARCDLSGLRAALPADHDDHDGRDPRRHAAGAELRQWRRNPPAARHFDRRRAVRSASC